MKKLLISGLSGGVFAAMMMLLIMLAIPFQQTCRSCEALTIYGTYSFYTVLFSFLFAGLVLALLTGKQKFEGLYLRLGLFMIFLFLLRLPVIDSPPPYLIAFGIMILISTIGYLIGIGINQQIEKRKIKLV